MGYAGKGVRERQRHRNGHTMARLAKELAGAGGMPGPFRRMQRFDPGGNRTNQIIPEGSTRLGDAIRFAVGAGLGVVIAPTRDGGALSITILDGDSREKGYASDPDEFDALLGGLNDYAGQREGSLGT